MIVTCPHCQTNYDIDDACVPTGGRSVRCAACSESWYVPSPVPIDMLTRLDPDSGPNRPSGARLGITSSRQQSSGEGFGQKSSAPHFGQAAPPYLEAQACDPVSRDETEPERPQPIFDGAAALAILNDVRDNKAPTNAAKDDHPLIEEADWEQIEREVKALDKQESEASHSPFHRELEALESALLERGPGADSEHCEQSGSDKKDPHTPASGTAIIPHDPSLEADIPLNTLAAEAGASMAAVGRLLRQSARLIAKKIARQKIPFQLPTLPQISKQEDAPAEEEEAVFVYTPGDDAVDQFRAEKRKQQRRRLTPMKIIGWTSWLLVLGGLIFATISFRHQIMTFAPSSKKLYAAIGLYNPAPYPVEIISTQHRYAMSSAGPVVELRGVIRHTGSTIIASPMLRAEAFDRENRLLAAWEFAPQARQLQPSMETPFLSRAPAPEGVDHIKLILVPPNVQDLPIPESEKQQFYMESTVGGWADGQEPPPVALEPDSANKD